MQIQVLIQAITLENFRCHEKVEYLFGPVTLVLGRNGAGKSTLAEAVGWCLYGTDIYGKSKHDENLMRLGAKRMAVAVTFAGLAQKPVVVARSRTSRKGSVQTINGQRPKPGQIEGWFGTVTEFLSVFVPGFFSNLEPKDAKTVLSRCIPSVEKEDVLARLVPDHANLLAKDKFVMGIDSVEYAMKRVREDLKESEDAIMRMEGQLDAYASVMTNGQPKPFVSRIPQDVRERYEAAKQELLQQEVNTGNTTRRLEELTEQQSTLGRAYRALRDGLPKADTHCHTCGQKLPTDKAQRIRQQVAQKRKAAEQKLKEMYGQGVRIKAELERLRSLPAVPAPDPEQVKFLADVEKELAMERNLEIAYAAQVKLYEHAKTDIEQTRENLEAERIHVLSLKQRLKALTKFRFEFLRIQHEKLKSLFEHVQIELMDWNKETGEIREAFRVTWDGRPYRLLSFSEKIRCDAEVGRVLAQARGVETPVYVDNAESVEHLFKERFAGQVIAAYVSDAPLTIKIVDTPNAAQMTVVVKIADDSQVA